MDKRIVVKSNKIINKATRPEELLNILLDNRKIDDLEKFLKSPFPEKLDCEMEEAVEKIKSFKDKNILIYGDYDVDGVTATAILWQVLYKNGYKVTPYVPDREKDGYGIRAKSFFEFEREKGIHFDLLITVDNGIVAHKEIEKIINKGTEVIITDHHEALEEKPKNCIIIHSREVCGSAISWFLAKEFDKSADLGLAALGTVADCLPLTGINRNIVIHGLQQLRLNPSPGIKKLIQISGIKQDSISAYDLGFILGPRINAIGRLSNPTDALRLLCSQNTAQAGKYAQILDDYNRDRQSLQKDSLKEAESLVAVKHKIIFTASENFLPGIIGLIAGRLTEKYNLPSVVISLNGGVAKGSCRSIPQVNIIETLRQFSNLFIDLGGHAGAAGFSIEEKNIKKLQKNLEKYLDEKLVDVDLSPVIEVEAEMKIGAVNIKNIKNIKKLEPFGIGNPQPAFILKKLKIVNKKLLGLSGDHLKLKLDDPQTANVEYLATDAIAFKKGEMNSRLKVGELIDVIATLDENNWGGVSTPQLIVKEIMVG